MVLRLDRETLGKVSLLFLRTTLYLNQRVKSLTKTLICCIWITRLPLKKVFTPKAMISLYTEAQTEGSFKCGSKRYEVGLNVNETSTFTSTVTGETYIINHKFNCNDKRLVYLLTFNCRKKQ